MKRKKRINDEFAPIGTTGYRIKKFRVLRDMSQTELGVKCGISEVSAVGRISQYETNKQLPRDKSVFKVIANALNLDESAIFDLDLSEPTLIYHLLFELESMYQISPCILNDVCYIRFSDSLIMNTFIKDWAKIKEKYAIQQGDSEETKKQKIQQYEIWKGEYPKGTIELREKRTQKKKEIQDKIASLQKELELIENDEY